MRPALAETHRESHIVLRFKFAEPVRRYRLHSADADHIERARAATNLIRKLPLMIERQSVADPQAALS